MAVALYLAHFQVQIVDYIKYFGRLRHHLGQLAEVLVLTNFVIEETVLNIFAEFIEPSLELCFYGNLFCIFSIKIVLPW